MSERALNDVQRVAWHEGLALWGVRMHEATAKPREGKGTFAWFTFPPSISIDPVAARAVGADAELATVFAHEIGHHVLSPSTRLTSLKITQQMARALTASSIDPVTELADRAHSLGNLWSDMLINVRVAELQRRASPTAEPGMIRLWSILSNQPTESRQWWVVLRAYEDLWGLPEGRLCPTHPPTAHPDRSRNFGADPERISAVREFERLIDSNPEADAAFLADTVRTFGADPVRGALRFGMVLAPYLLTEARADTAALARACAGDVDTAPATPAELDGVLRDARLNETPRHPVFDEAARTDAVNQSDRATDATAQGGLGQAYGLADTLELYSGLDQRLVTEAWYASAARAWVEPLRQPAPAVGVPGELPGPTEQWDLADELESIDWPATLATSPRVIPGVTTRLRTTIDDDAPTSTEGVWLDLYIDSSGSMPRPELESPAALAGTILILSVLRGGGRVRVTSFSGPGEVAGDERFTRRRADAMHALLSYFGGGTTFPLDLMGSRYERQRLRGPSRGADHIDRRHLVVLSDDGLGSMFGQGQAAYASVAAELRPRLESATLLVLDPRRSMAAAAAAAGYDIDYLDSMAEAPAACARLAQHILSDRTVSRG